MLREAVKKFKFDTEKLDTPEDVKEEVKKALKKFFSQDVVGEIYKLAKEKDGLKSGLQDMFKSLAQNIRLGVREGKKALGLQHVDLVETAKEAVTETVGEILKDKNNPLRKDIISFLKHLKDVKNERGEVIRLIKATERGEEMIEEALPEYIKAGAKDIFKNLGITDLWKEITHIPEKKKEPGVLKTLLSAVAWGLMGVGGVVVAMTFAMKTEFMGIPEAKLAFITALLLMAFRAIVMPIYSAVTGNEIQA